MADGALTRHFGRNLVDLLADRFVRVHPGFDRDEFVRQAEGLEEQTLMARIDTIAAALGTVLSSRADEAWSEMRQILPEPLSAAGKTFNDGYWMLPLARFWSLHHLEDYETAMIALAELTRRGTAEFAIRPFVERYPERIRETIRAWTGHDSFHVRRLASEGTRPNLPWSGRLAVSARDQIDYFSIIAPMARDESAYVRRSVGNHARDLRRIDPDLVDAWERDTDPPADVRKLSAPRPSRGTPTQ